MIGEAFLTQCLVFSWYHYDTILVYLWLLYDIVLLVDKARKKKEEAETARSIRLSRDVWERLDADASRCQRSAVKQLEAVLRKYFRISDVDITLEQHRETGSSGR